MSRSRALPVPAIDLVGCARSQARVASLLVRLRAMDGVERVSLPSSEKSESSSRNDTECRGTDQMPQFDLTISYEGKPALAADAQPSVPSLSPRRGGRRPGRGMSSLRRLVVPLLPAVVILGGFWFALLAPTRGETSAAQAAARAGRGALRRRARDGRARRAGSPRLSARLRQRGAAGAAVPFDEDVAALVHGLDRSRALTSRLSRDHAERRWPEKPAPVAAPASEKDGKAAGVDGKAAGVDGKAAAADGPAPAAGGRRPRRARRRATRASPRPRRPPRSARPAS